VSPSGTAVVICDHCVLLVSRARGAGEPHQRRTSSRESYVLCAPSALAKNRPCEEQAISGKSSAALGRWGGSARSDSCKAFSIVKYQGSLCSAALLQPCLLVSHGGLEKMDPETRIT
jgi:hypothetical protein